MKLRNKKTGEIVDYNPTLERWNGPSKEIKHYVSLAELNAEWEDVPEEPKKYWYIYADKPQRADCGDILEEDFKAIGNYFETREEAEKAVEKLKAWKRLEDKGFRFILDGETEMPMFVYSGANGEKCITSAEESKQCRDDIKLLFGGEK